MHLPADHGIADNKEHSQDSGSNSVPGAHCRSCATLCTISMYLLGSPGTTVRLYGHPVDDEKKTK